MVERRKQLCFATKAREASTTVAYRPAFGHAAMPANWTFSPEHHSS
jgi:hypothetical protein